MAKKKSYTVRGIKITSASQAWKESEKLDSIISHESWLTQRILIYVAELLEEHNALLALLTYRSSPKAQFRASPLWPLGSLRKFFKRKSSRR